MYVHTYVRTRRNAGTSAQQKCAILQFFNFFNMFQLIFLQTALLEYVRTRVQYVPVRTYVRVRTRVSVHSLPFFLYFAWSCEDIRRCCPSLVHCNIRSTADAATAVVCSGWIQMTLRRDELVKKRIHQWCLRHFCLLYTSDAADE